MRPVASIASKNTVVHVRNLKNYLRTDAGVARVVDGISFKLRAGETLGVVGESGSGKSMLVRSLLRLTPEPPSFNAGGNIIFEGVDLLTLSDVQMRSIRGRDISMIFQDPMTSLNPVMRIGKQITEVLVEHRAMKKQQAREETLRILADVGIPSPSERFNAYPGELSGGLRQRVMVAIAIACRPKLLLADEPTTALDVSVQAQILGLLKRLQRSTNMAMVFVSHDLGTVAGVADQIAVMYAGRIVECGPAQEVLKHPRMPYTKALLKAVPYVDGSNPSGRLNAIGGRPPSFSDLPSGCPFRPRCPRASDRCAEETPELTDEKHRYACWHPHLEYLEVQEGSPRYV